MEEYISAEAETSFTTEEVEALIEVGALLSSNLRLEEVVEILMDQAVLLVKAATGVLWLKQGEEAAIVPAASYGLDYDAVALLDRQLQDYVNGLAAAGKPVITGNGKQEGCILERATYAVNFAVTSMVFLPLINKGRLLGCLQLINKQDGSQFSRRDIRLCHTFASQAAVIIDNSLLLANQEKLMISLIRALTSALDARDPYTRGHSERVSRLSLLIAREMGLSPQQQEILQQAALLHDVGKIGIRDNVLLEPGPLDEDKWRIMKSHPVIGAQIIQQIEPKSVMKQIYEGVMYHQEKYDGSGYPGGLRGKQIPLVARIIAIADAYDAITSDRPYRKGKSPAEALAEIKNCAGKHFDPQLVEVFLKAMQGISKPADG
ncbi:HD domain-containing phosphohydrolase [Desulforamulus hydrothermalis]|uniref:Metal dependent phosphohydrolase n=1 Tax=Desulforamulus hydrothermalis Lam5 = DSM 18033 TaxID=1121428 RepID=K8DYE1_9FIRM|nr:HD domain-containing phosphohydrolase [Desulforamulus hydrothermalis]CCO07847.1 Metal dependent phosphohydrolase [Desulforamulus hydrothermalis Lam5 = DSM 18033]SHH27595.1 HDIG domain-containing protein [Desulforamulus hydrothermalis Lam5 = DSM 18033]